MLKNQHNFKSKQNFTIIYQKTQNFLFKIPKIVEKSTEFQNNIEIKTKNSKVNKILL